jgi:uncharacterized damage-inducible protein DinB
MSSQVRVATACADTQAPPVLIDALQSHLTSLSSLIGTLDADIYVATPSGTSGSIGEHVRHCLDHAKALTASVDTDTITYDARDRGTSVETHPLIAAAEIELVRRQLSALDDLKLDRPMALLMITHRDGPPTSVETTLGREVAFVVQHTIHHCALVAMLLDRLGLGVPARFGYAPSTPARR